MHAPQSTQASANDNTLLKSRRGTDESYCEDTLAHAPRIIRPFTFQPLEKTPHILVEAANNISSVDQKNLEKYLLSLSEVGPHKFEALGSATIAILENPEANEQVKIRAIQLLHVLQTKDAEAINQLINVYLRHFSSEAPAIQFAALAAATSVQGGGDELVEAAIDVFRTSLSDDVRLMAANFLSYRTQSPNRQASLRTFAHELLEDTHESRFVRNSALQMLSNVHPTIRSLRLIVELALASTEPSDAPPATFGSSPDGPRFSLRNQAVELTCAYSDDGFDLSSCISQCLLAAATHADHDVIYRALEILNRIAQEQPETLRLQLPLFHQLATNKDERIAARAQKTIAALLEDEE